MTQTSRVIRLLGGALLAAAALVANVTDGQAQEVKGGPLRIGILNDISNFDPQSFLVLNFPVIKNLYDSLIEYTPDGKPVPSLATAWSIAPDGTSVTVTLRQGVTFMSGQPLTAQAVATTLQKAADPKRGKNVYATMAFVKGWTVIDPNTIRLDFTGAAPQQEITDLLQFISVIDPTGIDTVETKPAGSGAYMLADRVVGQRIHLVANPRYWRTGEPVSQDVMLTIFSEDAAASAALESGAIDLIYGGTARSAVRLHNAGYQLIQGPGKLVQVLRINPNHGPFRNEAFRQAFLYLMDRANILRLGYVGLGQVVVLPWAPVSPAFDPSYNQKYAFDLDKAKALLTQSGLSAAEMSDWKLMVDTGDQSAMVISQLVQNTLARAGIKIDLETRHGADFADAMLGGKFDAMFGAVGNIQKFPSRLATNSIYRTVNNVVLGSPNPFPDYVAAIARVNETMGPPDAVKAAYDNLNQVLVKTAFGIPTNTVDSALLVAAKNVGGFTLDIDNMLVARTVGFTH
jgi:peptide/nickel transport system substrate-binding protein